MTNTDMPTVSQSAAARSITYSWKRPEVSDTRAVNLVISHDRHHKGYHAALYVVDMHDGYVRFMVAPGTSITLRRQPTARYSRKALAAFCDEVYGDLMHALSSGEIDPRAAALFAGNEYQR